MQLLELTMPLNHEYMADEVFPTATPFIVAPGGHPLKGFSLGTEAGTCLTLPSQFTEDAEDGSPARGGTGEADPARDRRAGHPQGRRGGDRRRLGRSLAGGRRALRRRPADQDGLGRSRPLRAARFALHGGIALPRGIQRTALGSADADQRQRPAADRHGRHRHATATSHPRMVPHRATPRAVARGQGGWVHSLLHAGKGSRRQRRGHRPRIGRNHDRQASGELRCHTAAARPHHCGAPQAHQGQ